MISPKPMDRILDGSGAPAARSRGLTLSFDLKARWFWAALVVLLSAWIIHSFFLPLAWAAIIAIATWPVYQRFASRMRSRMASDATPLILTILVWPLVLGPM